MMCEIYSYVGHCFDEENRIPTSDEVEERFATDLTLDEAERIDEIIMDFIDLHDMEGINNEFEKEQI